jgi:hypothetical protein
MNPAKFLSAAAVYFIASFTMGYLWHIIFFKSMYDGFIIFGEKTLEPNMLLLVVGTIIEALAFAFLYIRLSVGKNNVFVAIMLAVCLYLFASSYGVFAIAATAKIQGSGNPSFIVTELSYMIVAGIVCGGLVGLFVKTNNAGFYNAKPKTV